MNFPFQVPFQLPLSPRHIVLTDPQYSPLVPPTGRNTERAGWQRIGGAGVLWGVEVGMHLHQQSNQYFQAFRECDVRLGDCDDLSVNTNY